MMKAEREDPLIREYVQKGVIKAELNDFFEKALQKEGFSGFTLEIDELPYKIQLRVSNTEDLLGEDQVRVNQYKMLVAMRLGIDVTDLNLFVEKVKYPGLCPATQAEAIRAKMEEGWTYRRATQLAINSAMKAGAQGIIVAIRGKLKGQRARAVKTIKGRVIHSGTFAEKYVKKAQSSVFTKTGIIGIKISIMLPYDPKGIKGPAEHLPDTIKILD